MPIRIKKETAAVLRKALCCLMAVIFLLSAVMTGTYAWLDYDQHKTNEFVTLPYIHNGKVVLYKYEKEPHPETEGQWVETDVPIQGTEFYLYSAEDDALIGGPYLTSQEGEIKVEDLAAGEYYFKETRPTYGYNYDKDAEDADIEIYPFVLTENDEEITVQAFNRKIQGALIIEKELKNRSMAALSPQQLEQDFVFIVMFGDGGTYSYTIEGVDGEHTLQSGETITLRHGQKAMFQNLPIGLHYRITEAPVDGHAVQSSASSGNILATGAAHAKFENIFEDGTEAGALQVQKQVSGDAADLDKEFAFTIEFSDGNSYPYSLDGAPPVALGEGGKFTLKHGQTAAFVDVPIGVSYTVTEDDYSVDGYTPTLRTATGTITYANFVLLFNNSLHTTPPPTGALHISKTIWGDALEHGEEDFEFVFVVTFSGDGGPYAYSIGEESYALESGGELRLKHGQTAKFEDLAPGTVYTVEEKGTHAYAASAKYSSGVIAGGETAQVAIINDRITIRDENTDLTIKKTVAGNAGEAQLQKEFFFTLRVNGEETRFSLKHGQEAVHTVPVDAQYEVYEDDYSADGYIGSIVNGAGTAVGQTIEIVQTNTYTGSAQVIVEGEKTWDVAAYPQAQIPGFITVQLMVGDVIAQTQKVYADENGEWKYSFTAPQYNPDGATTIAYTIKEEPVPGFVSSYNGNNITNTAIVPVTASPQVRKKITGDTPLLPAGFQFVLQAQNSAPMPQGSVSGAKTVSISGTRSRSFGAIQFTAPGEYSYTIYEVNDQVKGYTYDTGSYTYTVTVVQNNNVLQIASETFVKNGIANEEALFTNAYSNTNLPGGEKVTVQVRKVWDHGTNPAESRPQHVMVYVKNGSTIVAQKQIGAAENWAWNFSLDKYDAQGREIKYTVDEAFVPEYFKSVDGYSITNTYTGGTAYVTLEGQKHWDHGKNAKDNHPGSVTIYAMEGDTVVSSQTVTAQNDWRYSFILPKYNQSGAAINYRIDEEAVPGYGKYVKGTDVYNTFGRADGVLPPRTGDENDMLPWILVMIASGAVLVRIWYTGRASRAKRGRARR